MVDIKNMTMEELCGYIANHLRDDGIPVVLVGGACVSFYSNNEYQTRDLDFIQQYDARRKDLAASLAKIGFTEKHRYFEHPDTDYFLEFPSGPISVDDQPVHSFSEVETEYGTLILLTATDICKDRLAAYFHWNDRQSLEQAVGIATRNEVDLEEITKSAHQENMPEKYSDFLNRMPLR